MCNINIIFEMKHEKQNICYHSYGSFICDGCGLGSNLTNGENGGQQWNVEQIFSTSTG
jgi:hypothetical protein